MRDPLLSTLSGKVDDDEGLEVMTLYIILSLWFFLLGLCPRTINGFVHKEQQERLAEKRRRGVDMHADILFFFWSSPTRVKTWKPRRVCEDLLGMHLVRMKPR